MLNKALPIVRTASFVNAFQKPLQNTVTRKPILVVTNFEAEVWRIVDPFRIPKFFTVFFTFSFCSCFLCEICGSLILSTTVINICCIFCGNDWCCRFSPIQWDYSIEAEVEVRMVPSSLWSRIKGGKKVCISKFLQLYNCAVKSWTSDVLLCRIICFNSLCCAQTACNLLWSWCPDFKLKV